METALVIVLLLSSVAACFLPWITARNTAVWEYGSVNKSTTNFGYQYIIPTGATWAAPVGVLNVAGYIISIYSLKATQKFRKLNVIAGLFIIIGAAAAYVSTFLAMVAEVEGHIACNILGGNIVIQAEYGIILEVLSGFLMIIAGIRSKPEIF